MKALGYFTTPKVTKAAYKATGLDTAKRSADILLQARFQAIDGNYYTLWLNREIELKGRGLKERNGRIAVVTENYYEKLNAKYNVLTDF